MAEEEPLRIVELRQAFQWFCEDCGHSNFAQSRVAELTDADRETVYRTFHQLEPYAELPENWEDFDMCCIPTRVTCEVCKTKFSTQSEERC